MRTFTGRVQGFSPGFLTIELPCGTRKTLRCSEQVRRQGLSYLGRQVRFQAHLDEGTESLASPLFVIGSQFGLQAVAEQAQAPSPGKVSGVREKLGQEEARVWASSTLRGER
jgi:hypothetical protein